MSATNPPKRGESTVPPAWRRRADKRSAEVEPAPSASAGSGREPIELRLAIGRGGLGLELGKEVTLGCLDVTELTVSLPAARFPLDVSGGVARFRHQRGVLSRVSVELSAQKFRRWAQGKLRGVVGTTNCDVWIAVRPWGATLCVSAGGEDIDDVPRVLAFDVTVSVLGEDVSLLAGNARGRGLPKPATALAMEALGALVGTVAKRTGARFVVEAAITKIARTVLPEAGARAPETDEVRVSAFAAAQDAWILHASWEGLACEPNEASTRELETAALTFEADEARAAGDYDAARSLDVTTLERAPRHPAIAARIAEIDAFVGGRAEAALATLAEAERGPAAAHLGFLRAELLTETGDMRAAIAAFERVGESEGAPQLSAAAFERASELSADRLERLSWLNRAIARGPAIARLRWKRIAERLELGRLEDAMADVEHLEAQSRGPRARYAVFFRAGSLWLKAGLSVEAAPLFERALRFVPDDPPSLAGLGRALVTRGRTARGIALLTRALDRDDLADVRVELARALAEKMDDRPAAIAHVRSIRHDRKEAPVARALEGKWRAELGDLSGAALAYAKLRDHAETMVESAPSSAEVAMVTGYLLDAANFERHVMKDFLAAQRHLAAALRLSPNDGALLSAYRAVGEKIAGVSVSIAPPPEVDATAEWRSSIPPEPRVSLSPAFSPDDFANMEEEPSLRMLPRTGDDDEDDEEAVDPLEDEARVDELTRRLQLDPTQDDVVDELSTRLLRLGRSHELFALLAARLEDASPDRRASLIPKQREVLLRLEADARARGSEAEADLFVMARKALD